MARRHLARDGAAGHREDRDQAAGAALLLLRQQLHQARRDRDLRLAARRHPARQGARPVVPGAQEGRRHQGHAAAGRQRPVLQRRIRRHLQPDLGLRVRRLPAGRGQGHRQGRTRSACCACPTSPRPICSACRTRRSTSSSATRGWPCWACRSIRSSRSCAGKTPSWRPARSRPRASASRSVSTARRSPPRNSPRCPSAPTAAPSLCPTWPRSSAATRIRSRSRCASRASR